MTPKPFILTLLLASVVSMPLFALDMNSSTFLSSSNQYTYNRTLGHEDEFFFFGEYQFAQDFTVGGGFSTAFNSFPERFFVSFKVNNHPSFLQYSVTFLSRDFPDYEIRENSIYPTIGLLTRFFELEVGLGFRFLGGIPEGGTISTQYKLKFFLLNFKKYQLTYTIKNFDNFYAANITAISHNLDNMIKINDNWMLTVGLGLRNAGQVGMSSFYSAFYGSVGIRYYLD